MDTPLAMVIAATITGGFGFLAAAINKYRKENAVDHAVVIGILRLVHKSQQRTEDKVDRVDERLTRHIESHASEGMLDNGRTVHQDGVETNSDLSA
jgi:hypothetical protein